MPLKVTLDPHIFFGSSLKVRPGFTFAQANAELQDADVAYRRSRDLMAQHFNTFMRLAPQSPSRAEVQSIMRTLGARH